MPPYWAPRFSAFGDRRFCHTLRPFGRSSVLGPRREPSVREGRGPKPGVSWPRLPSEQGRVAESVPRRASGRGAGSPREGRPRPPRPPRPRRRMRPRPPDRGAEAPAGPKAI